MKKIIISMILAFASASALANAHCDTRRTSAEVMRCYKINVDQTNKSLMNTYNQAMASNRLSEQHKRHLENKVVNFYNRMNNGCRDDRCVVNSLEDQRDWIVRYFHAYATK